MRRRVGGRPRQRSAGAAAFMRYGAILVGLLPGVSAIGCGEVRLVDPLETDTALEGAVFEVVAHDAGHVVLDFRAHAYGFEVFEHDIAIRYLDAGELLVDGRRARRNFVRVGQPEYILRTSIGAAPSRIDVQVHGSSSVPACELDLVVPIGTLPDEIVIGRSDLVIPLPTLPKNFEGGERVSAQVRLADRAGNVRERWITPTRTESGTMLVLGSELVAGLATGLEGGPAELSLTIEWSRSSRGPGGESRCAPSLVTRSVYEVVRRVQLPGGP
mgnify:FL=1